MPQEILLLPEEEYPEGGRWWEKEFLMHFPECSKF